MKFEVLTSSWNGYDGGAHEEPKPSKELLRHLAGAEAAGVVKVTASRDERAQLAKHVESQADSEKARAAAQKDGRWHEGNLELYLADVKAGRREHWGPEIDPAEYVESRKGMSDERGEVTRG